MASRRQQLARQLGRRIVDLRAAAGLTQEQLAWNAELGSKGYLSRIESGQRLPSLELLDRLAHELRVELHELVTFTDAASPRSTGPAQPALLRAAESRRAKPRR